MGTNPFAGMMQQMQKAQEMMQQMQSSLKEVAVIGEAGAGMVKVHSNGLGEITKVEIEDAAYQEGKKIVEELVAAASNDAKTKREAAKTKKMQDALAGLGLPANFSFPFFS